jgi:hypothetical protein
MVKMRQDLAAESAMEESARKEYESAFNAELRAEKLKHSITSNSPLIRELEKKLSSAYMTQERALQIHQKELLRDRELERLKQWESQKLSKLASLDALEEERNAKAVEQSEEYQVALEAQLEELEEKKRADYATFLREKAMVDEIVKGIKEEDEREMAKRMAKQNETRVYVEAYMIQRQEWRRLEEARIEAETQKIKEHAEMQIKRFEEEASKKSASSNEKTLIYDKVCDLFVNFHSLLLKWHDKRMKNTNSKHSDLTSISRSKKRPP